MLLPLLAVLLNLLGLLTVYGLARLVIGLAALANRHAFALAGVRK